MNVNVGHNRRGGGRRKIFSLSRGKGIHDFKEDQGGSVVTKIIKRGDLRKLNGNKLLMRGIIRMIQSLRG